MSKICVVNNCEKHSYYGKEHNVPLHCPEHRTFGEINVVMKWCEEVDCKTIPTFNFPN